MASRHARAGVGIGRGEGIAPQYMCQLKNYGQGETKEEMHGHKGDEHIQEGMEKQWYYKSVSNIEELRQEKQKDFQNGVLAQFVGPNMA